MIGRLIEAEDTGARSRDENRKMEPILGSSNVDGGMLSRLDFWNGKLRLGEDI